MHLIFVKMVSSFTRNIAYKLYKLKKLIYKNWPRMVNKKKKIASVLLFI